MASLPKAVPCSPPPAPCPDSVSLSGRGGDLQARVTEFWSTAFPQLGSEANEAFVSVAARNLASLAWETIRKTYPETAQQEGVEVLLELLGCLSPHSAAHSRRVGSLARALARELGLSEEEQQDLETGAQALEFGRLAIDLLQWPEELLQAAGDIHDIGKLKVPPGILDKAGPLDEQEWALVKLHPVVGEYMLQGIPELASVLPAVRGHHERWDGRGYPDQRSGEAIPLAARILALADSYDAMTEVRPYRQPFTPAQAFGEILKGAGGQFDPKLSGLFLRMLARQAA